MKKPSAKKPSAQTAVAAGASRARRRAQTRAAREGQAMEPPVEHPHAAGIDISVKDDLFVDVGPRAGQPSCVRTFSPRTAGLRALCAWLRECAVETVAMEATGSYWLSIYLELTEAGFSVVVVNPRTVHLLRRKSDLSDCQQLRYLHSVGLLKASFVPAQEILSLRTLARQREALLQAIGEHTQRLQKALDEMNLHPHHVISDLLGATGCAIIEAILAGERDARRLAARRDRRIQAPEQTIIESLEGRWNEEHLLVLRQEYASCQHLQQQVAQCDEALLARSRALPVRLSEEEAAAAAEARAQAARAQGRRRAPRTKHSKNDPAELELWRRHLHQLFGIDLTLTPGVSVLTVLLLLCEIGLDWSRFPTAAHFASWLGLCPEHRISGGKILSRTTRTVQNRVRQALKQCAQSLWASQSHLGEQYRRLRARLGPAKANTALAHKLARILWHQVQSQSAYDESFLAALDQTRQHRAKLRLARTAAQMGYDLVPRKEAA